MTGKKGNYIVFEGPEHCGKTIQSSLLKDRLKNLGISYTELREPGKTPLGAGIRTLLLDDSYELKSPEAELFLFEAARTDLFEKEIIPGIKRGDQVISDRSYLSTEAYQGYGGGMDLEMIRYINKIATKNIRPDLAFIFDLSLEQGLDQKTEKDRIESLGNEFHQRVRQGYLEIAAQNPDFCVLIERENKSIEQIHEEVKYHVKNCLGL